MSTIELENWLPVETRVGKGYAFLVECHEADNWYTVILDTRAIVTVRQQDLLVQRDYSHQRGITHDMMREIIKKATDGDNARRQSQEAGGRGAQEAGR